MDCIRTICLYLKEYISHEQFESIFHDYLNDFQNCLREDICFNILSTNFSSKEKRINMETELRDYVLKNHGSMYEDIDDAYVERMIDSEKEDIVVEILKKNIENIIMKCKGLNSNENDYNK